MKKNLESNVKYILDNLEDLDLSPVDKEYINKTINFLKFQVTNNLIHNNLIANERLLKQVENTLKHLEGEEKKLDKEIEKTNEELIFKFDDYVPLKAKDDIFQGLQAKVEESRLKQYNLEKEEAKNAFEQSRPASEKKLSELENKKNSVVGLKQIVATPENFIEAVVSKDLDVSSYRNIYQTLIKDCAESLLGEDADSENAEKLFVYNEETKTYEPNKKNLEEFFQYGRNQELSNELKNFYDRLKEIKHIRDAAEENEEESEEKLSKRVDIKSALYDREELKAVEDGIFDIYVLFEQLKDINEEKIEKTEETQNSQKQFPKLFDRLVKKEVPEEDEEDNADEEETETFNELVEAYTNLKNLTNYSINPKASIIYEFYLNIAKSKVDEIVIKTNINAIKPSIYSLDNIVTDEIGLLYSFASNFKFEEIHEIIEEIIDSKVDEAQNSYTENKKDITEYESKEKELVENLSDKAKEYYEKFNKEFSIGNFNNLSSNNSSLTPLVASLVLETALNIKDVKTSDDISKFGITFTDEDINKYQENINNTILPNMERILVEAQNFNVDDSIDSNQ